MRFLIDMNLTPRWVAALSAAGHEAVHWSAVGPIGAPDSAVCEYARDNGFALITNSIDFPSIFANTLVGKPSVILLRGELLVPEVRGEALLEKIGKYAADLESGAILTIDWSDGPRTHL